MATTHDKLIDTEYEEHRIEKVSGDHENGWSVTFDAGSCCYVPNESPVEPKAGMTLRLYGKGFGFTIRGMMIGGIEVFYRTEAEQRDKDRRDVEEDHRRQRAEFEVNREKQDAQYNALPQVFRDRIDKFRYNNPDFRWKYESYELFCCEQAVAIAARVKADDLNAFRELTFNQQRLIVPELSDGHSGNTFGCACKLAYLYLVRPDGVEQVYGAMAPLVGSEEYGCVPKGGCDAAK